MVVVLLPVKITATVHPVDGQFPLVGIDTQIAFTQRESNIVELPNQYHTQQSDREQGG